MALAAAVAAAVGSTASATGTPPADAAYRALLVGLTTYLGARLRLPTLVLAAAATAALSGGHGWAALGASAAAGAVVAWQLMGRSSGSGRAAGPAAVTAACCALSLLQPGATLPRGLSAVGSGTVLVVVCALGYTRTAHPVRRRVRLAGLATVAVVGAGGALAVVALAQARPPLQLGVSAATRATAQAGELDSQAASRSMASAAAAFERANRHVRSPLGQAGALVPLLSQHVRAVDVASASGADLGWAGAELAEAVDQDSLRIVDGRVPLERLQEAQPKAARAASAIATARGALSAQRSPWLVPPLASRLDRVESQLAAAGDQADRAAGLLAEVPPLLGSDGPRRYFVALQTSSEIRGSGGFMGSFAEIAADDGRLALTRTGRPAELNAARSTPKRTLDAPEDFIRRYGRFRVEDTWESVTISPHFPSDAQVIRGLYPQSGGGPVDAVVAVDPVAIQAILQVVGPIRVAGAPEPLTGDNAARVLLFDQYVAFGDGPQDERRDFLAGATRGLMERLLRGSLPLGPLVKALQPMVQQKHIMASAGAADEEPAFRRLGLTGAMAPVQGDALAVVVQNAGASKIDWFLRRKIDYSAVVDPGSGRVSATATIQLTNQAPARGLPQYVIGNAVGLPPGTSRLYVSIYSPLLLQGATRDGKPLALESEIEQGRGVFSAFVDVPAGATATVKVDLTGAVPVDGGYRLDLHRQPSAAADEVSVSLGVLGAPGPPVRRDVTLESDTFVAVPLPA